MLGVLLLLVFVVIGSVAYLRGFNPDYDGRIRVEGLKDPVVIERDELGVPFIQAQGEEDLFLAWGYANAQDRMFQMEVIRRASQGRLSEFAGEGALTQDLFLRAMRFYELARQEAERLPQWIRMNLQRYADGVNLHLSTRGVPLQMRMLGLQKEPWGPADPIAVGMMLNWTLAGNMRLELLYHGMAQRLGRERCERLLDLSPAHTPTIMEGITARGPDPTALPALMGALGPMAGSRSASNNWVVGPRRSAYKGPILANDPHVHDSKIPSDFCLVRLKTRDYEVAGGQVAGLPFIPFGYNQHMAWGVTNNGADIVDLFLETVDERHGTFLSGGKPQPLTVKKEVFQVKGKGPVDRTLRWAGRRPLLNEVFPQLGAPVSLDWIGFEGATIEGFFHLNGARDYAQFQAAARRIGISAQNMVYADHRGNIAYQLIGLLPERKRGTGNLPRQAAAGGGNWDGPLPAEKNPSLLNPKQGFIITANNKVVSDFPTDMNGTYAPRYRYERIHRMLLDRDRIDAAYIKRMQTDSRTELAGRVLLLMKRHITPRDARAARVLDMVLGWDGWAGTDSTAAAVYNTFLVRFMFQTLVDELGEDLAQEFVGQRYASLERFLSLADEGSDFFDDVRTPRREGVGEIATRAFHETLELLSRHTGSRDPAAWTWGKLHAIRFDHVLGRSRLLARLVNEGPFPFQGDCETNNRAHFTEVAPPFTATLAAGLRLIVVFDPQPRGEMMLITGQNEWFMSRHYKDMTRLWLRGDYFSVEGSEAAYRLEMVPSGR
jgi:penicillin amidase